MADTTGVGTDMGGIAFSVTIDTATFDKKVADIVSTTATAVKEISEKPIAFNIDTLTVQKEILTVTGQVSYLKHMLAFSEDATRIDILSERLTEAQTRLAQLKNIGKEGFDEFGIKIDEIKRSLRSMGLEGVTSIEQIVAANKGEAASIEQLIALQSELTAKRNTTTDLAERNAINGQISTVGAAIGISKNAGSLGYDELGNKIRVVTDGIIAMQEAGVTSVAEIIAANKGEAATLEQLIVLQKELTFARNTTSDSGQINILNKELETAEIAIGRVKNAGTQGFDSVGNAVEQTGVKMNSFKGMLGGIGANFLAFMAVSKVIEFGAELLALIPKVEGVDNAFARLGEGENGLNALRVQTKGLISDLQLEKFAVKFADFNIPVDKLGYLLSFASVRAQGLGLSVEDVAEKMVSGIGARGSRAFTALGISAEQFTAAMAKTGNRVDALALAISDNLVGENLDKIETLGDKMTKLGVSAENAKKKIIEFISAPFNDVPGDLFDNYKKQQEKRFGETEKMTKDQLRKNSKLLTDEIHEFDKKAATARDNQVAFEMEGYKGVKGANEFASGADYAIAETEAKTQEKARQATLEIIKAKLKNMSPDDKDILNTIKKLTDAQAAVRDELVDKTDPKEIKTLTNKANKYQKQIDDLDGTTDNNNRKKAEAAAAEQEKKRIAERKKGLVELKGIQDELLTNEKQLAAGELTETQQKIYDLIAKYEELRIKALDTQQATGISSTPTILRINKDQAAGIKSILDKQDKKIAAEKADELAKADEDAFKIFLGKKTDLFKEEQDSEGVYGLAATKKLYKLKTDAFGSYMALLDQEITKLQAVTEDGTATKDQIANLQLLTNARDKAIADQESNDSAYYSGLILQDQTAADKRKDIAEQLVKDIARITESSQTDEEKAKEIRRAKKNAKQGNSQADATSAQKSQEEFANKFQKYIDLANELGSAFTKIGTALEGSDKAAGELFKDIGGTLTEVAGLAQAYASGGLVGLALKALSDTAELIANIISGGAKARADLDAFNFSQMFAAKAYDAQVRSTALVQAEADKAHLASLNKLIDLQKIDLQTIRDNIAKDKEALSKGIYTTGMHTVNSGLFGATTHNSDDTATLNGLSDDQIRRAGEMGDIKGKTGEWYKQWIADQTELNNLIKENKQDLIDRNTLMLGQSTDSITTSIEDSIKTSTTQFVDFGLSITEILRKSIIAGFFQTPEMVAEMKAFEDHILTDLTTDGGTLTAAHAAELKAEGVVIQLNTKKLTTALNDAGVGVGTGTNATISSAFKGITEDTAELLAGRFNALGLTAINQLDVSGKSLLSLISIERNTFNSFQALDYITQNMVKAGAVDDTFNKTLRAGGTFL